jgi:TRAP-type uncharacterized transport system fused permease subunit
VAHIVALIAGIGLIIGSLSVTGVANSFSRELVQYAAGNIALLLFFGAVTSFILGMEMTASACYIFLAIVLAPALVQAGLDPMASHLYVLYQGIVSFITPPVALAAIAASSIAKSSPMRTGMMALRIGILLMLLPVLFVLQSALILRGDTLLILQATATAAVAVLLLASAFEGYVYRFGPAPVWARVIIGIGGLLMLIPEARTDLFGFGLTVAGILAMGHDAWPAAEGRRPPGSGERRSPATVPRPPRSGARRWGDRQRGALAQRRAGVAAAAAIARKSAATRLAPPTSAPSTSGCDRIAAAFPGLTEPP